MYTSCRLYSLQVFFSFTPLFTASHAGDALFLCKQKSTCLKQVFGFISVYLLLFSFQSFFSALPIRIEAVWRVCIPCKIRVQILVSVIFPSTALKIVQPTYRTRNLSVPAPIYFFILFRHDSRPLSSSQATFSIKKIPANSKTRRNQQFFYGGSYKIRTYDFFRVKEALSL